MVWWKAFKLHDNEWNGYIKHLAYKSNKHWRRAWLSYTIVSLMVWRKAFKLYDSDYIPLGFALMTVTRRVKIERVFALVECVAWQNGRR